MVYMICYGKTQFTYLYKSTLVEALALATRLEKCGYLVSVWEKTADYAKQIER